MTLISEAFEGPELNEILKKFLEENKDKTIENQIINAQTINL